MWDTETGRKVEHTYRTEDPFKYIRACLARDREWYHHWDEDWEKLHSNYNPNTLAQRCMQKEHVFLRRIGIFNRWKEYFFVNQEARQRVYDMIDTAFKGKRDINWRVNQNQKDQFITDLQF